MESKLATTRSLHYDPDVDTLDIWIGDPSSETHAEPATDNLVIKYNSREEVIGFEIIELSRLDNEDISKIPKEIVELLKESANRLSIATGGPKL
jgi:uncharacterized protein YuzE